MRNITGKYYMQRYTLDKRNFKSLCLCKFKVILRWLAEITVNFSALSLCGTYLKKVQNSLHSVQLSLPSKSI